MQENPLEEVDRIDWIPLGESEANHVTCETRELGWEGGQC